MDHDFDVIVIGSGAGGSAFAIAVASAGRSVLVLERGADAAPRPTVHDERETLIEKAPYDDRRVQVNGESLRLYMGGVVGGGTAVFGGVMLRPAIDDFHPGRRYSDFLPPHLWDWPIGYEQLEPYFTEAEALYGVEGSDGQDYTPLQPPKRSSPLAHLPLAPINDRLMAAARRKGLRPFFLPLAIDASKCLRCDSCAGYQCINGARRSAAQLLVDASRSYDLHVASSLEAVQLHPGRPGRVDSLSVLDRRTDVLRRLRAKYYVLAAGAIGSPSLLLKSGFEGRHLGRNYMLHYSPIVAGLFARRTGADETFVKQVGFADFYFGTSDLRRKMGLVQSLPAPGPLMLQKAGLHRLPERLLRIIRRRLLPLAGIIEDLPRPENRVLIGPGGALKVQHAFHEFDRRRGEALSREMSRILRGAGAVKTIAKSFPSYEHVAHQCGTLRMGRDPREAATDADGRLFGYSNLYVADASTFPTSLGIGPSLTVVANALRIARNAITSH